MKLNLGSGDQILDGYTSVDLYNEDADIQADVRKLPFEDDAIEEIYASHIIEHFDFFAIKNILKEWARVLVPNGILTIETPDLFESCLKFITLPQEHRHIMYGHFFAKPWLNGETHKFLFTKEEMIHTLKECGFDKISFESPTIHTENPNMRVVCRKS